MFLSLGAGNRWYKYSVCVLHVRGWKVRLGKKRLLV
jgi:hypothetical protein